MKAIFGFILMCVLVINADAQTKRIAHRSHSGAKNASYEKGNGAYGLGPQKVKIHLESGRDTMVHSWDSLANPMFIPDTLQPKQNYKPAPIENIRQMGQVTGKMIQ